MTHYTEIHKLEGNYETVLGVGRSENNSIYIDVKLYKNNEVIDGSEIIISYDEWEEINSTLKTKPTKYFRCPKCGDIVTENEILEDLINGSYGACMCQFGNGSRTINMYEPYDLDDFKITEREFELIKNIRNLYSTN